MSVDIDTRGPLFNGTAGRIIDHGCNQAERDLAEYAHEQIQRRLQHVLRHPTGRYMSSIGIRSEGPGLEVTSGVIYHWWLEGVGSRNRTTRFKGYFTFRIVGQRVEENAERVVDPAIDRAARRL